jgi:ABC-type branched-subunit amino acid transport system substrate-binding protein
MKGTLDQSRRSVTKATAAIVVVILIAVVSVTSVLLVDPSLFGLGKNACTTTFPSASSTQGGSSSAVIPTTGAPKQSILGEHGENTQVTALSSSAKAPTPPQNITIVFGATLSLSGTLQAFGQEQNWTLSYAIDYVNSLGGIPLSNGSYAKIKLVVLDDGSDPTKGLTNLQTLASADHASIIMGELGGVQDSVAYSFSQLTQIPYIGPVYISAFKNGTNSWIFAPFENQTNEAHVFLNWFDSVAPPSAGHPVCIAFFGEGDPAAHYNNQAGEAYASQLGYEYCTCSDTTFTPLSQSEMTTFISSAKANGVQAIYGLPLPPDAVLMLNTAIAQGFTPKAWMLTRGTAVAPFAVAGLGGLGNQSAGAMSAFPWNPLVPYTGNILGQSVSNPAIVQAYEQVWGHPPTLEGVYYTQVLVAVDAIAAAGNLSNIAIRNQLRTMTFDTPMGVVNFTPGGQWIQSDQDILLMQWQNVLTPTGQPVQSLEILKPTNIATTSYLIYPFSYENKQNSSTLQTSPWPPS